MFLPRGERGLEKLESERQRASAAGQKLRVQHGAGKAKEQGQATRPQPLISRGATNWRSN